MNLQQENKAEKQLIVGALKVLNNIEGGGFEAVASDVNKIQQALGGFVEKQNEYWKDVAADNVINAFEKKSLKKEWEQIEQTYNAIIAIAQEKRLIDADEFKRLADTRQALYVYLFQTLKVFDNMSESTPIPDTTVFSQKYNDYYEAQSYAQSKIAGTSAATIRVLNSLDELGTENEIAIYRNCLYMYKAGQWIIQNSGMYLGAVRDAPPTHMAEDNFFLAINDFKAPARLKTSNGLLVLSNGKYLQVTKPFYSGWIYVSKNGTWNKMEKTDYRYAIVLNDLLNYKLDVPDTIKDFIKANTEVDFAIPEYLGPYDHDPSGAKEGDWYLYVGPNKTSPDTRNNGYIYRYKKENDRYFWQELNPNSSQVESYYMAALKDILVAEKNLTTGMYSTIFARALFACKATLEALSTTVIELKEGQDGAAGILRSENYRKSNKVINVQLEYSEDGKVYYTDYNRVSILNYVKITEIKKGESEIIQTAAYVTLLYIFTTTTTPPTKDDEWQGFNGNIDLTGHENDYFWACEYYSNRYSSYIQKLYGPVAVKIDKYYGFHINTNGNADFLSDTHIGGDTVIDGNTTIEGNTTISGKCDIGGNAMFRGKIQNEVMEIKQIEGKEEYIIIDYPAGTKSSSQIRSYFYGLGLRSDTSLTVSQLYKSENAKLFYNDIEVSSVSWISGISSETWGIWFAYKNGGSAEITALTDEWNIKKLKALYDIGNTLSVIFHNLPPIAPSTPGRLWNDNGILKISS